jgi:uncharacterized protein
VIEVEEKDGGAAFSVRVIPRSHHDAVEGEYGGAVKIRLSAPPLDDRANESLCRFLAERLNVSNSAVRITAGQRSRTKRVKIAGVTRARVLEALSGRSTSTKP